jgi:hypothetical protein
MNRLSHFNCQRDSFSTYLGFLISAANELATDRQDWLDVAIRGWEVNMEISDYGLYLNEDWSDSQVGAVCELCRCANQKIRAANTDRQSEIALWPILPQRRGHEFIPSEPLARFGEAMIALLEGNLAEPPTGHIWFYTLEDHVELLKRAVT